MRGALRAALLLFFLSAAWAPRVSAFGLQSDDSGLNVALESRWTSGALDARIQAVRALGAPDLGAESAPQRAAELAAIVRAGREKSLRDAALDTLALVEGPVAEALLI